MTWAALSDDLIDKMQHHGLTRDDQLMYVEGLVHATRLLTDGELPADLTRFTTHPQAAEGALRLLALDYWRVSGHGYAITEFLRHNRTAKQVRESQERSRARTRRWRLHREGDHSMCLASFCGNAVTNAVTNGVSDVAPSSPLLSSREEKEKEKEQGEPGREAEGLASSPLTENDEPSPSLISAAEGVALLRQALANGRKFDDADDPK